MTGVDKLPDLQTWPIFEIGLGLFVYAFFIYLKMNEWGVFYHEANS